MKLTTYSGLPRKRFLSSGFWVATPTGQVSRLHTRIMTHPKVTILGQMERRLMSAFPQAFTPFERETGICRK